MRLFLAAFPSQETLEDLRDIFRGLDKIKRNFRFVNLEQIHITVKFLGGDISSESYEAISGAVSNIMQNLKAPVIAPEELMFGFPGQQYPTALFLTVEPNRDLDNLIGEIHDVVKDLKLPDVIRFKDRRKVVNHITIGRTKRSVSKSLTRSTREAVKNLNINIREFIPTELYFVESILTPKGPVYRKLSKFDFPINK